MSGKSKDITGLKFGYWTVLRKSEKKYSDGTFYWICQCKCGKIKEVRGTNLRRGTATMCGFSCAYYTLENRKQKFLESIEINDNGCWIWKGYIRKDGYGYHANDKFAHRYSYELFIGEIPLNLCVCHKCDIRNCVNPEHLWIGTNIENTQDKINKGRQPKLEEHPMAKLTKENVIQIREMYKNSKITLKNLSEMFKVSSPAIASIIKYRTWKF